MQVNNLIFYLINKQNNLSNQTNDYFCAKLINV